VTRRSFEIGKHCMTAACSLSYDNLYYCRLAASICCCISAVIDHVLLTIVWLRTETALLNMAVMLYGCEYIFMFIGRCGDTECRAAGVAMGKLLS